MPPCGARPSEMPRSRSRRCLRPRCASTVGSWPVSRTPGTNKWSGGGAIGSTTSNATGGRSARPSATTKPRRSSAISSTGRSAPSTPGKNGVIEHLELVEATAEWWATAKTEAGTIPPDALVHAWRRLYRECWLAQADWLLGKNEAVRLADPRLCRPAADVAAGDLVDDRFLRPISPIDGRAALDETMAEHERRRSAAMAASLRALPLHRRVRADRRSLDADYDASHFLVCPSCALPRNDDEPSGPYVRTTTPTCRCCGGALVPLVEAPELPPPLEESVRRIAVRRAQLQSHR